MARPTKYKPEMCKTVIDLMEEGASQQEVLAALDISNDTFYRWKKENEEFSETIKRESINPRISIKNPIPKRF